MVQSSLSSRTNSSSTMQRPPPRFPPCTGASDHALCLGHLRRETRLQEVYHFVHDRVGGGLSSHSPREDILSGRRAAFRARDGDGHLFPLRRSRGDGAFLAVRVGPGTRDSGHGRISRRVRGASPHHLTRQVSRVGSNSTTFLRQPTLSRGCSSSSSRKKLRWKKS